MELIKKFTYNNNEDNEVKRLIKVVETLVEENKELKEKLYSFENTKGPYTYDIYDRHNNFVGSHQFTFGPPAKRHGLLGPIEHG